MNHYSFFLVGSLAYDSIMDFPGKFGDHILPEKVHVLSVSFTLRTLNVNYGGTVGNIAFGLAALGERPTILASAGSDFSSYARWFRAHGVDTRPIHRVKKDRTAAAYIMTDRSDNQIAGFYPGAMRAQYPLALRRLVGKSVAPFLVISTGNLQDMTRFADDARRLGIPY
ncbi:MAG: carbohydrate kinase family protein, partial [Candidatus Kerfeldbacteria bacterium]|nr:carbohydrate kinase family protein [Candidatus Kerfeldbacteria bacterium]